MAALIAITTIRQYPAQDNAVLLEERQHPIVWWLSDEYRRLCAGEYPMNSGNADFSTILNRILDTAADNLRIAKILVQMGLDPNNITYDALFNRMLAIVLANISLANMFALVGTIFLVATLLMHTMVPLRIANMAGCTFFVAFGALSGNVATFILHLLLLPINAIRLRQMLNLIKKARIATEGDTSIGMAQTFHDRAQISPGR